MINWILGGLIVVITLVIVYRSVKKTASGKTGCSSCKGCALSSCPSSKVVPEQKL